MFVLIAALLFQNTWTENDRLAASADAKLKLAAWTACIDRSVRQFSRLREPAETIATAALGACGPQEGDTRAALEQSFRGLLEPPARAAEADRLVANARLKFREAAIARVLNERSKAR